ncbi:uncharacterized protein LOC115883767 [Sitophilus oryzae]|uniref:Uncharacterized protein LOC115883767 n=1 Tax=Sitophilus oryzae TaxID=7048 RepID=A0A6J2Y2I6_SITOR|nr:uncharacterized protein LOC115883767 [Sitophilus oryzae]
MTKTIVIFRKYGYQTTEELETKLKMKLQAKGQRLRRYTKRSDQYRQNKMFNEDMKKFYRSNLNKVNNNEIKETPDPDELECFWRGIFEEEKTHNKDASWIQQEKIDQEHINEDEWKDLENDEIIATIKRTHNWKSPGPDKVHNFWIKQLTPLHTHITGAFNLIIKNPENTPEWLTTGKTILLSKGNNTKDPRNYRPITCLPTLYKIMTQALSNRIYNHLNKNNILPPEQKGCKKGSRGCKDQLLLSKIIMDQQRNRRRIYACRGLTTKKLLTAYHTPG